MISKVESFPPSGRDESATALEESAKPAQQDAPTKGSSPQAVGSPPATPSRKKMGAKPKIVKLPPLTVLTPKPSEEILTAVEAGTAITTTCSDMSAAKIAKIEEGIAAGLAVHRACARAGISHDTYENWRKANPTLAQRFALVDSEAEFKTVRSLEENAAAGNRCWTAYAWKLERRYGWHLKTETKTTTDVNLTISRNLMATLGNAGDIHHKAKPTLQTVDVEAKELDVR